MPIDFRGQNELEQLCVFLTVANRRLDGGGVAQIISVLMGRRDVEELNHLQESELKLLEEDFRKDIKKCLRKEKK